MKNVLFYAVILLGCLSGLAADAEYRRTYWLFGDSHLFKGGGLQKGLCERVKAEGAVCRTDARIGARVQGWTREGLTMGDRGVYPDDWIVLSLGMNSSRVPPESHRAKVKRFVDTFGNRSCIWIFPSLPVENEAKGFWKMMRKAVKPCIVFDSRAEMEVPDRARMGVFHVKIGYAKKVWAKKVWDFVNGGY